FASVGPDEFHRRTAVARGKLERDHGPFRSTDLAVALARRGDANVAAKIERPEGRVEEVAAHVAEGAAAVVPKAAPFERRDQRAVVAFGCDAEPEVPIQRGGNGLCRLRQGNALGP